MGPGEEQSSSGFCTEFTSVNNYLFKWFGKGTEYLVFKYSDTVKNIKRNS